MSPRLWIAVGALIAAAGVAAGAFGAHGLRSEATRAAWSLTDRDLENFDTAARYQLIHALAIVACGLSATAGIRVKCIRWAGGLFVVGTVVFSGGLYLYVFTHVKTFAMIVPLGGVSFILGWLSLAWGAAFAETANP